MQANGGWNELLDFRRVAIVGPAGYLENKENGSFIDSFDIVARVGDNFPREADFKDYGARTDLILDVCANWVDSPDRMIDKQRYVQTITGKHIRFLMPDLYTGRRNLLLWNRPKELFKTSLTSEATYENLKKETLAPPTKGLVAIADLLETKIEQLYVTGFSFFHKPLSQKVYADFYYPEDKTGIDRTDDSSGHHSFKNEWNYFKRLANSDRRIWVDPWLMEAVKMDL
jgi:hypothetical protein